MESFFNIKIFKSRKKMMQRFFSMNNFKSHKKVTESFSSGHAQVWRSNFLEQCFLCQYPLNIFDYNNILVSMKKDSVHISVNTVRATFLLHK